MTEDEHWGDRKTPKIDLANRVMTICRAPSSVVSAWAPPLYDRAFDREPELRNKLFCLLASGLLDAGWEYRSRIAGLAAEAKKLGSISVPYYLGTFERYIALAADLLGTLSRNDMIVITELRTQFLHGHWSEAHKQSRVVYYSDGNIIHRNRVSVGAYNKIFYESIADGVDQALEKLRHRFCKYRTFFWTVDRTLASPEVFNLIQEDVLLQEKFKHPRCVLTIPEPSFRPLSNASFQSLMELGPAITPNEGRWSS